MKNTRLPIIKSLWPKRKGAAHVPTTHNHTPKEIENTAPHTQAENAQARLTDHAFFQDATRWSTSRSKPLWFLILICARHIRPSCPKDTVVDKQRLCARLMSHGNKSPGDCVLLTDTNTLDDETRVLWGQKAWVWTTPETDDNTSELRKRYRKAVLATQHDTLWLPCPNSPNTHCLMGGGPDLIGARDRERIVLWGNEKTEQDGIITPKIMDIKRQDGEAVLIHTHLARDIGAVPVPMGLVVREKDLKGFWGFCLKILARKP